MCDGCKRRADGELKKQLRCPLCERGHELRDLPLPDLVAQKRKLAWRGRSRLRRAPRSGAAFSPRKKNKKALDPARWVHVARLPLVVTADDVRAALEGRRPVDERAAPGRKRGGGARRVEWIADRDTGFFYGSAYVEFDSEEEATEAVARRAKTRRGSGNDASG